MGHSLFALIATHLPDVCRLAYRGFASIYAGGKMLVIMAYTAVIHAYTDARFIQDVDHCLDADAGVQYPAVGNNDSSLLPLFPFFGNLPRQHWCQA